jgi:hypothetical protein
VRGGAGADKRWSMAKAAARSLWLSALMLNDCLKTAVVLPGAGFFGWSLPFLSFAGKNEFEVTAGIVPDSPLCRYRRDLRSGIGGREGRSRDFPQWRRLKFPA